MRTLAKRMVALATGAMLHMMLVAQAPLSLDVSFGCDFNTWYVSSILPLDDGSLLASGKMKFGNDLNFKNMMRFLPNGDRDFDFATNGIGGGTIRRWGDRLYVEVGQAVRRLYLDGEIDYDFIAMSTQTLFSSLQGGDYHVYPDGSILMSGAHSLYDTARATWASTTLSGSPTPGTWIPPRPTATATG
ncbi:MAG: hypothetical protein R2817_08980 [Flavobacteriales bacterium]